MELAWSPLKVYFFPVLFFCIGGYENYFHLTFRELNRLSR